MDVALRRLALVAGDGDDEASTKREWIPVNEVVRAVLPLARAAAERRGTRVELSLEPGLPRVLADRASFAEALTLLVTECAGRSDADHPLRVATARDTATALVTITPPLPTGTGASETQATTWIVAKRLLERDSGTLSNEPEGVLLRFSTA